MTADQIFFVCEVGRSSRQSPSGDRWCTLANERLGSCWPAEGDRHPRQECI